MQLKELTTIIESLESSLQSHMTPYGMHKITNESLGTHLPPQMFYNYVNNGYITAVVGNDGKLKVEKAEVLRWIKKYAIQNIVSDF